MAKSRGQQLNRLALQAISSSNFGMPTPRIKICTLKIDIAQYSPTNFICQIIHNGPQGTQK